MEKLNSKLPDENEMDSDSSGSSSSSITDEDDDDEDRVKIYEGSDDEINNELLLEKTWAQTLLTVAGQERLELQRKMSGTLISTVTNIDTNNDDDDDDDGIHNSEKSKDKGKNPTKKKKKSRSHSKQGGKSKKNQKSMQPEAEQYLQQVVVNAKDKDKETSIDKKSISGPVEKNPMQVQGPGPIQVIAPVMAESSPVSPEQQQQISSLKPPKRSWDSSTTRPKTKDPPSITAPGKFYKGLDPSAAFNLNLDAVRKETAKLLQPAKAENPIVSAIPRRNEIKDVSYSQVAGAAAAVPILSPKRSIQPTGMSSSIPLPLNHQSVKKSSIPVGNHTSNLPTNSSVIPPKEILKPKEKDNSISEVKKNSKIPQNHYQGSRSKSTKNPNSDTPNANPNPNPSSTSKSKSKSKERVISEDGASSTSKKHSAANQKILKNKNSILPSNDKTAAHGKQTTTGATDKIENAEDGEKESIKSKKKRPKDILKGSAKKSSVTTKSTSKGESKSDKDDSSSTATTTKENSNYNDKENEKKKQDETKAKKIKARTETKKNVHTASKSNIGRASTTATTSSTPPSVKRSETDEHEVNNDDNVKKIIPPNSPELQEQQSGINSPSDPDPGPGLDEISPPILELHEENQHDAPNENVMIPDDNQSLPESSPSFLPIPDLFNDTESNLPPDEKTGNETEVSKTFPPPSFFEDKDLDSISILTEDAMLAYLDQDQDQDSFEENGDEKEDANLLKLTDDSPKTLSQLNTMIKNPVSSGSSCTNPVGALMLRRNSLTGSKLPPPTTSFTGFSLVITKNAFRHTNWEKPFENLTLSDCLHGVRGENLSWCKRTLRCVKFSNLTSFRNILVLIQNCPNIQRLSFLNVAVVEKKSLDKKGPMIYMPQLRELELVEFLLSLTKYEYWLLDFFTRYVTFSHLESFIFRGRDFFQHGENKQAYQRRINGLMNPSVVAQFLIKNRTTLSRVSIGGIGFQLYDPLDMGNLSQIYSVQLSFLRLDLNTPGIDVLLCHQRKLNHLSCAGFISAFENRMKSSLMKCFDRNWASLVSIGIFPCIVTSAVVPRFYHSLYTLNLSCFENFNKLENLFINISAVSSRIFTQRFPCGKFQNLHCLPACLVQIELYTMEFKFGEIQQLGKRISKFRRLTHIVLSTNSDHPYFINQNWIKGLLELPAFVSADFFGGKWDPNDGTESFLKTKLPKNYSWATTEGRISLLASTSMPTSGSSQVKNNSITNTNANSSTNSNTNANSNSNSNSSSISNKITVKSTGK